MALEGLGHFVRDAVVCYARGISCRAATMDMPNVELPFLTSRVLVVSDFNCPYCFTLNEWIAALGAGDRVRWLGVEHRPDLPETGPNERSDMDTLARELADVRLRAPEVEVERPRSWQNSRAALLAHNALEDDHPEIAHLVRRAVFQSYWCEGDDLTTELFREKVAEHGGQVAEPDPAFLVDMTSWWRASLDRIPCMLSPTGVVHRGLQDFAAVRSFLNAAIHSAGEGPGCR